MTRPRALVTLTILSAIGAGLLAGVTTGSAEAVGEASGGVYVPVAPTRVMDTAGGIGTTQAPMGTGSTRNITVQGVAGVPTSGVSAVVVDIAVKNVTSTSSAYLKVWPAGETMPGPATMFYTADNATRSNTAVVKVGTGGKIAIYSSAGNPDVDMDIQGYFTATSDEGSTGGFVPISPTRVANTLTGQGVPNAQLAVGSSVDVQVAGGEIPADATAVFANIEVASNSSGNLRIVPSGTSVTGAPPTVNYQDNGPTSSGVMLRLADSGKIRVYNSSGGSVNFKVDVQGYFSSRSDEGGSYTPVSQEYLLVASGAPGQDAQLAGGETRIVPVAGVAGIPTNQVAGSVSLTLTARNWSTNGTVTAFNPDLGTPPTTNLNFKVGEGVPSNGSSTTAIVELSDAGTIAIRNTSTQPVTVYIAAQGWFSWVKDLMVMGDLGSDVVVGSELTMEEMSDRGVAVEQVPTGVTALATTDLSIGSGELAPSPYVSEDDVVSEPADEFETPSDPDLQDGADEGTTAIENDEDMIAADPLTDPSVSTARVASWRLPSSTLRIYRRPAGGGAVRLLHVRYGSRYPWTGYNGQPRGGFGWKKARAGHNLRLRTIGIALKYGAREAEDGTTDRFHIWTYRQRCWKWKWFENCRVVDQRKIRVVYQYRKNFAAYGDYRPMGMVTGYCLGTTLCPDWVYGASKKMNVYRP